MCAECERDAIEVGEWMDKLIEAHSETVKRYPDWSSAMHCVGLATTIRNTYLENQGIEHLQNVCLGLAVTIHRLAALQQINGGAL